MMAQSFLLPLIVIFPLILLFLKHFKAPKCNTLPPGPKPWPILGNILQIGRKPHVTLSKFAGSYGPLISLRLGTQILIVGSSPRAAEEIFKTHDRILSGRQVPHAAPNKRPELNYLSFGWAFECNDQWKFLRTLLKTELFSGKSMDFQASLREKKVSEMVEYLNSMEGKVVELGKVVFPTVFNMLSNIFMSKDFIVYGEDEGMKGLIRKYLGVLSSPNLSDLYPIFARFDLQGLNKKSMKMIRIIWAIWEPTIKERRERKRSGDVLSQQDFLYSLLDNGFTDDEINYLFLELFTAGTDTSISTIEWVMGELIKHPKSMTRAREELDREINKGVPKESHLNHLPYLQACVKETLRLHPPGPLLLPHRALESCKVMGYTIPKNSQVMVNVWAIGRDPDIWEDPLAFKPERFLNSELDFKGNDFEYIPFGAGRRMCPGLPMATKHVPLILASLIYRFDWSLPFGKDPAELDMTETFDITLLKEQPLALLPESRKNNRSLVT